MTTKTIYLIWNSTMTECVGTDDALDAHWIAHGSYPVGYENNAVPSIGETFREYYADDDPWDDEGKDKVILQMTEVQVEDRDIVL